MPTTVAVIGAGMLGLSAVKNLTEDGFIVTGFESRAWLGGLWKYSDDENLSVQETTVFNSSKLRSAYSDFPFDESVGDFPTHQDIYKYLNDYADHFDIRKLFRLETFVVDVSWNGTQWVAKYRTKDGSELSEVFDKVMVASGYFNKPHIVNFEGMVKFEGRNVHSKFFHRPEQYKNENVLLVGLHATTQDVAKALDGHAKHLYLSHRNGLIIMKRYQEDGAIFDSAQTANFARIMFFLQAWFPNFFDRVFDKLIKMVSKSCWPNVPKEWNFSPAPPVYITNPMIADEIYPLMESGWAEPVSAIKRFTGPRSVEMVDGTILNDVDSIIHCTGYTAEIPFLKGDLNPYPVPGQQGNFYRNMFLLHPDPAIRNSIAFVGHGGVAWPGFSAFELQAVAVSQIWLGNSQLPPFEEQKQWLAKLKKDRAAMLAKSSYESTHYPAILPLTDHMRFLEEAAGTDVFNHFGWSWKAWKFWWEDRKFYNLCTYGLFSPAMWRLFETGKRKAWSGAREQIYKHNEELKVSIERRRAYVKSLEGKKVI